MTAQLSAEFVAKFLRHVEPHADGLCWGWNLSLNSVGYGQIWVPERRTVQLAHRLSYEIHIGDPGESLVCHTCDNRACVNPSHFFLGTHMDNARDMVRKGRSEPMRIAGKRAIGSKNHGAKLIEDQVREILRLREAGVPLRVVADKYGVTMATVSLITLGKKWRHVTNCRG